MREGWAEAALGDVVDLIIDYRGKTPKKLGADWQDAGIPAISAKNIKRGRIVRDESIKFVSDELYRKWMKHELAAGDILLTSEAPLGETLFLKREVKMVLSQRLYALRVNRELIDPRFLCYYLESEKGQFELNSRATGATAQGIRQSLLREVIVSFPSDLQLQREIAAILSAYDDLIANNLRRIAILEEMAQLLYGEWFVRLRFPGREDVTMADLDMGQIPHGWEIVPFTDVADVLSGGTPKTTEAEYWDGRIPFFAPKDAPVHFYVTETEKSITDVGLSKCSSKLYPKDTVFITARGTVGKVVMPGVEMAMNQSCYALVGREGISQHYLYLLVLDSADYLKQNTGGATFDTIVVDTFRQLRVLRPPLPLIQQFSDQVNPIFSRILADLQRNANLRRSRDLLLPNLISGDLDVSELDIVGVPE